MKIKNIIFGENYFKLKEERTVILQPIKQSFQNRLLAVGIIYKVGRTKDQVCIIFSIYKRELLL